MDERDRLWLEYAENIPRFRTHRCPFCKETLEISVDDVGLDGPWWWKLCPVALPPPRACDHFEFVLGALDLRGRGPTEATEGVAPGPGAPFVIDRLLSIATVKAVLANLELETGDVAYLTAYFSSDPLEPEDRHQEWRKTAYALEDDEGEPIASHTQFDAWNFEIDPWIEREELLWIHPGDELLNLRSERPSPFSGATGLRFEQQIVNGELTLKDPPDDRDSELFASESRE